MASQNFVTDSFVSTIPPPDRALDDLEPIVSERTPEELEALAAATIYAPGDAKLDSLLDLMKFLAKPMSFTLLLDELPQRIAAIVDAQVASLYLLEGEGDELVLRANVGFPLSARGRVRLRIGEGITGLAVKRGRPISVADAAFHQSYRPFPELDEGRYPVFLAVPILGQVRPLGALVIRRAGNRELSREDMLLVVALTAPLANAIRHAQLTDQERSKTRRTGGGTRKVTLPGLLIVCGRALGAIAALRRPAPTQNRPRAPGARKRLRAAFDVAERTIASLSVRAKALGLSNEARFLGTYALILTDSRLRDRAYELVEGGKGVAEALAQIAREVARTANSGTTGDPFLQERARDIEDLCDALLMLAAPDARAELPQRAVLLGNDLSVFDLIVSARSKPVGIVLTERAQGARTRVLLALLGVPSIVDVGGAFRWAAPGDVVLIDADHGFLVINPSKAEIARVRAQRKTASTPGAEPYPPDDSG